MMCSRSHKTKVFALMTGLGLGICGILLGTGGPTRPGENVAAAAEPPVRDPAVSSEEVAKVIVPFVEKHCVQCHGEKKPKGDLSLSGFKDDESILKAHKIWLTVVEKVRSGEMPPKGKPQPSPQEIEQFEKSVKGVFDRYARSGKRDPGRVTMRRLSKYEYQTTIRDLLGVRIPLADDFPGDVVAHGFDNLGDANALSPHYLDRYMAAAEALVRAAIVIGEPPPPPKQNRAGVHGLQPEPPKGRNNQGRLTTDAEGKPLKTPVPAFPGDGWRLHCEKGPLEANLLDLFDPGDYKFVARLQGYKAGKEDLKFALLVNGKEVFQGVCGEATEEHVVSLQLKPGKMRIGVALLNEDADPKDPRNKSGVIVHDIALIGPLMPPMHAELLAAPKELEGDAKSRHVIARFASRAYRRPATKAEVDRLMKIVKMAEQVPQYKLTEANMKKLRELKVPNEVLQELQRAFNPSPKSKFMEEDAFVKAIRSRLPAEQWKEYQKTILTNAETQQRPWEGGIALAMQAVISSPDFLFRVEADVLGVGPQPLDDYALATRLSYFLWSSMPDQELFDLAAKKQLHKNLAAQVKRMLADPKSAALVENFAAQWLKLRSLSKFEVDAKAFPEFETKIALSGTDKWAPLRNDMLAETTLFLGALIQEDRSVLELIDSDFTFLNGRLAQHYNIRDTKGNPIRDPSGKEIKTFPSPGEPIPEDAFVKVALKGTVRGGILTQASVLTLTSLPSRTSPVVRGAWILDRILGTPPPPPPPDVPALEENKKVEGTSLRQRLEQHRANVACAACHARIDPLGFAFENFDAIGRFRDKVGKEPIDVSAELLGGRKFQGAGELKTILLEQKKLFARNLAEKMFIYAVGRNTEFYDVPVLDDVVMNLEKNDYRFHALISAIVQSDAFRMVRGTETKKETKP
jgi:mono/diheme cytochrome c family protein